MNPADSVLFMFFINTQGKTKQQPSQTWRSFVLPVPLSPHTSFLHVGLVVGGSESGSFVCQQGHQSLRDHKVRGGDELVLLSHATQEAGQELPLDGVVHGGQVHACGCRDQVLEGKYVTLL